ncbi:MAG: deoxyribodipyrimidine photo-lyase [Candidatus Binatia bacterium]
MDAFERITHDPRVRIRTGGYNPEAECVVYWMRRSQRATDNPALNVAIQAGNLLKKPVVVFFGLTPNAHHANLRHYTFLLQGLKDIAEGLQKKNVGFTLSNQPGYDILNFCSEVRPCLLVGDENPLHGPKRAQAKVLTNLKAPFWTVDSDVVVPSRLLGKEHYAARTIRPKIRMLLPKFLRPIPNPAAKVVWQNPLEKKSISLDYSCSLLEHLPIDRSVEPVAAFLGGSGEARRRLKNFLKSRLTGYATNRNKPDLTGTSQLSPYLHFGHIAPHTIALAVQATKAPREDQAAFLGELIVRRELAVNFVRYNPRYERAESCEAWADVTLRKHTGDRRRFLYTQKQLQNAETHDPLWNTAQKQMVLTGWMHGYLRMYWAKKILEWSPSPAVAYDIAVRLNDRYELDGRDPNGYAGIAWAIVGKHDRAWGPERPIYGKVRYMSLESTSRKFNSRAYIDRITALERNQALES